MSNEESYRDEDSLVVWIKRKSCRVLILVTWLVMLLVKELDLVALIRVVIW